MCYIYVSTKPYITLCSEIPWVKQIHLLYVLFLSKEKPIYGEREKLCEGKVREPEDEEEEELESFCKDVKIILHTVNPNEFDAATTYIKPPSDNFNSAVIYPDSCMVVGKFADIKTAIIQTDAGTKCRKFIEDAHKAYPAADFVIGVGVGYAYSEEKCKLADVLVSKKISNFANCKFDGDKIEDRGETIDVVHELSKIFCINTKCKAYIVSTSERASKIHCGTICSYSALFNSTEMRDKFGEQVRTKPVGGEMEGSVLLEFQQDKKFNGAIIIKGVADYGDGNKAKDWQFTAAMAALHYAEAKLRSSGYRSK